MITHSQKNKILLSIIELLDLPDSAYEKARNRYKDIGEWFDRKESIVATNSPHIFPQGSFRLGLAIRPLDELEEYDLDLACNLRLGIDKGSHTQEQLKRIVGEELEAYRAARSIKKMLKSKHRCWRLEYQDDLSFHMDIVPCIPADKKRQGIILDSVLDSGIDKYIAEYVSHTTVSITDDRLEGYRMICDDWNISNPEGYAKWFEYRMNPQKTRLLLEKAQVDNVPLFKRKTPLQRAVQLLKRHRDNWSKENPDSKPISIIITTLAARAYSGGSEVDIVSAIENILLKMGSLVNPSKPRVPNPVNPEEDFADRWYREDCLHLKLEENFNAWLMQAKIDFRHLLSTTDAAFLTDLVKQKFTLRVNRQNLELLLGIGSVTANTITPKKYDINKQDAARPWSRR